MMSKKASVIRNQKCLETLHGQRERRIIPLHKLPMLYVGLELDVLELAGGASTVPLNLCNRRQRAMTSRSQVQAMKKWP